MVYSTLDCAHQPAEHRVTAWMHRSAQSGLLSRRAWQACLLLIVADEETLNTF